MALIPPVVSGTQVAASDLNCFLAAVLAQSYSISGTAGTPAVPAPSTLSVACAAQDAVVNNGSSAVFVHAAAFTLTLAASKDSYVDLGYSGSNYDGVSPNNAWSTPSVANGAAAPAVTANALRLWKIVTSGTTITSITLLAPTLALGAAQLPLNGTPSSPPAVVAVDSSQIADLSGSATAASATAGLNGAIPAQVLGYRQEYVTHNGVRTLVKIPYFAV